MSSAVNYMQGKIRFAPAYNIKIKSQGYFMNKKSFRTLGSLAIAVATASSGVYAAELEEIMDLVP